MTRAGRQGSWRPDWDAAVAGNTARAAAHDGAVNRPDGAVRGGREFRARPRAASASSHSPYNPAIAADGVGGAYRPKVLIATPKPR